MFYGWRIVWALGVTTIVSYGTNQYLFGLLIDPLRRELGWSSASIGAAYSGTLLVAALAGLALGPALDRFGARGLMSAGSLLSGVSLLLLARVHSLAAFDLLWTLGMGTGAALTWYAVSFTVVANWFDAQRPRALALLTFMGAFASPVFYPAAGLLIAAFGWRTALVVLGGVQLAVALPLHALVVRRHPEDHGLHPDGSAVRGAATPTSGVPLRAALRSAAFWLLTAALALGAFASTVVLLEHVAYLIARGYAPALAAALVGGIGLAYLPGRWLVALAHGRLPLALQFALVFGLEAGGVAVLLAARSVGLVVAYVVVFGAAYGATAPLRGAIVAERFGRRAYGAIIAAQGVPVGIAAALGPLAAGRLIDAVGYGPAFASCVAALLVAAGIVLIPVRVPRS